MLPQNFFIFFLFYDFYRKTYQTNSKQPEPVGAVDINRNVDNEKAKHEKFELLNYEKTICD